MNEYVVSELKHCRRCDVTKSKSDFHHNVKQRDGLSVYCKDCMKELARQYRLDNKEHVAEIDRIRRRRNYRKNREVELQKAQDRRRRLGKSPSDKRRKEREREIGAIVFCNMRELLHVLQGGRCLYCQSPILIGNSMIDHIVPLIVADVLNEYLGNAPENLALVCRDCNQSKWSFHLEEWLAAKFPNQMDEILQRVDRHTWLLRMK